MTPFQKSGFACVLGALAWAAPLAFSEALSPVPARSVAHRTVHVHNAAEFLAAIGPPARLCLSPIPIF